MGVKTSNSIRSISSSLSYTAAYQACLFIAIYALLVLIVPTDKAALAVYHLSPWGYKAVRLLLSIPSLLVWPAAFIGYAALRQYAQSLGKAPEGVYFERLAYGCTWLAWSLPIIALLSVLLSGIATIWTGLHVPFGILINYVNLILPLIAFSIIGIASRELVAHANIKLGLASTRFIIFLFLAAGVLYCYLTFSHFDSNSLTSTANPYHLPLWLMAISVIIPYLYAWFVGLLATYEITLYSRQVAGLIYRQALSLMVVGLVTIIMTYIALQYINGVSPGQVGHIVFNDKLTVNVLFRVINGLGFIILTLGALRLKKIEEV